MAFFSPMKKLMRSAAIVWTSPRVIQWRAATSHWKRQPYSGIMLLLLGTVLATLFVLLINSMVVTLPNPGLIYLPLVSMLAYHWNWRYSVAAVLLQLFCIYFFFISPLNTFKPLTIASTTQLLTLAAVTGFVLAIVQLARQRHSSAEQAAERFAALNRVGTSLTSELNESRLLHMIAETARNLTNAEFAAFTLRPLNEMGQPLVPSEGNLFHLAAVVGVTKEQEGLFRRMPLGGEGLLAPIFRQGVPVRVPDALALMHDVEHGYTKRITSKEAREGAQQAAFDYAHGRISKEGLRSLGVPRGHPIIRSFLGAPLLDRNGQVHGGLLLGHSEPDCFTQEDEVLLVGLAAQAAVALENARLYRAAQTQAQELDAIFESIADGITLVDDKGQVLRENRISHHLREALAGQGQVTGGTINRPPTESVLRNAAFRALRGEKEDAMTISVVDDQKERREYTISASPLLPSGAQRDVGVSLVGIQDGHHGNTPQSTNTGAVILWHDVTETQRLLAEHRKLAETEAQRALLQTVINELPSSVYLVRGRDARLVLANRATAEVWGAHWPYGQAMGKFLESNNIRLHHFDGRPLMSDEYATLRALRNGESVHHHQEIIRQPNGTTLPVLVNAVPLDPHVLTGSSFDTGGNEQELEPAAIVVHQDVTALKEAERLKDEFIGIAAHELRNPLAVLKGFAQMLIVQTARGKGPQLANWQMEAISDIDQATARLVELTDDLLDVTRLQAGRLELHIETVDLVALLHRVVARWQITNDHHTLSLEAQPEHIVVQIDPRRIEQVINNLISNAIKYSPDGGNIQIQVCADQEKKVALLSVRDPGIGIPAHQQARIFGRFARADNAREREIGGTGLGLYLSRELVERHNGHIWFESVEGQGSTFFVALPLAQQEDDVR